MTGVGKQWSVRFEMHRLLAAGYEGLLEEGYRSDGSTLEVLLRPGTTAKGLESAVRSASGRRDRGYWRVRGTSLGIGMLIGGGTLVVLALIDLFNQLVGATLIDRVLGSPWHGVLMLATFIAGGAVVSFAPRLLSADENWARNLALRWINEETKALSRINRRLKAASQGSGLSRVVVWNAMSPDCIGAHGIIECFRNIDMDVELQVHRDEQPEVWEFFSMLRERFPDTSVGMTEPPTSEERVPKGDDGADLATFLECIAGPSAAQAYGVAIQHSTYRIVEPWRSAVASSGKFQYAGIAHRLAAERFDQLFGAGIQEQTAVRGSAWMHRFISDYQIFVPDLITGVVRTTESGHGQDQLANHKELAALLDVRNPVQSPIPDGLKDDVASVFITLMRTEPGDWESEEFGRLLNHYVQLAAGKGHYRGINVLAEIIGHELAEPNEQRRLLPRFSIESLLRLHEPLSVAGHGQLAIRISRWIAPFAGAAGAIERAKILEGIGEYDAARAELDSIGSLAVGDERLTDGFLRRKVWLMLSAGRQDEGWGPDEARKHLEELDELFARPGRSRSPAEARELENFWALLLEWENNRAAAIERHRRAMDLPGVPLRRVLGTMINKGRTQRDLAVAELVENAVAPRRSDYETALAALDEAASVISRGYRGKIEIGDMDEAPIGAHNLTLARLYQCAMCQRLGDLEHARRFALLALEHAREGLGHLRSSSSSRKQSTLMAEAQVALKAAGLSESQPPVSWADLPQADRMNLEWFLVLSSAANLESS